MIYQGCPFCERVFELGREEYGPMRRHVRFVHSETLKEGPRPERAVA